MVLENPVDVETSRTTSRVERIAERVPLLDADMTCGDVLARFNAGNETGFGIDAGGRLAYVDRATVTDVFARRFGRELNEKRPITSIADREPFVAEAYDEAAAAAVRMMRQKPDALQRGFLVTHEGAFVGVARGSDLMRLVAEEALATLAALRVAQRDLIEAEKLASLGSLVAGVSHEINTPIGIALTAATQLQDDVATTYRSLQDGTLRRSELESFLGIVDEASSLLAINTRRAAELVQSFKQIAVDRSSDERRRFALADYVRDVVASLRPRWKYRPVEIVIEIDSALVVDSYPGALSQVVTNLVVNALTHAWPDDATAGTIQIRADREDGHVLLVFEDDGNGVPAELHARIFEPFFTTSRGRGGTGLGLGIVRNLVTGTLGGTVDIDASTTRGARFLVRIPVAPLTDPEAPGAR